MPSLRIGMGDPGYPNKWPGDPNIGVKRPPGKLGGEWDQKVWERGQDDKKREKERNKGKKRSMDSFS